MIQNQCVNHHSKVRLMLNCSAYYVKFGEIELHNQKCFSTVSSSSVTSPLFAVVLFCSKMCCFLIQIVVLQFVNTLVYAFLVF
jgi:hypothetical protein